MSRWRPPQPKQSAYITRAGFRALGEELRHLWKEKRPEVTRKVAEAAALGDRSENAEYIYGKRQLAEIDRRVRYLDRRIRTLTVVDRAPDDPGRVFFGAHLEVEDDSGECHALHIVGPDEIGTPGRISIDAPLARALLGHRVDDVVQVRAGDGLAAQWTIVSIRYDRHDCHDEPPA